MRAIAQSEFVGKTFGRLVALSEAPKSPSNRRMVLARCECGNENIIDLSALRSGITKSCGCIRRETTREMARNQSLHGECHKTPEHRSWQAMLSRCYNSKHEAYGNYGGRGIVVCAEWRDNYQQFLKDMGRRPTLAHTLERIENNGNYEASNCCWATKKEQLRNRRNNTVLQYQGRTMTLAEASELSGIGRATIGWRLRNGWSHERATARTFR